MQTIPQPRKLLQPTRQPSRCSKNKRTATTLSTAAPVANGFLKHRFLPLWEEAKDPIKNTKINEADFFNSLSILSKKEGIEPMDVSAKCFPYNILLAHHDAARKLYRQNSIAELLLVEQENGNTVLAKRETYCTGSTLFYIPVVPLNRLLKNRAKKKSAELLLSVFSYLCRIACIPYYRHDYSYLGNYYEILEEWTEENQCDFDNEKDYHKRRYEINSAKHIGDIMGRKIYSSYQLENIAKRNREFVPKDGFDRECLRLAKLADNLVRNYPNNNIFSNLSEKYDCEEIVMADEYISFICENEGDLYEEIAQMVNEDFGNKGDMQIPIATTFYERSGTANDLSYEQELFTLIEDLINLLNEIS